MDKRRWLEYGGIASGVILIAFGIGAVAMSFNGYNTVNDSLKAEKITKEATDGMTPDKIAEDAKQAGLPATIELPTCSVEGEDIDSATQGAVLRGVHADPRARVDGWPDLLGARTLRERGRRPQGHERLRRRRDG